MPRARVSLPLLTRIHKLEQERLGDERILILGIGLVVLPFVEPAGDVAVDLVQNLDGTTTHHNVMQQHQAQIKGLQQRAQPTALSCA